MSEKQNSRKQTEILSALDLFHVRVAVVGAGHAVSFWENFHKKVSTIQ